MRQLHDMYVARGKFEWAQTSEVIAILANINRKEGSKPISGSDINPFNLHKKVNLIKGKMAWEILKAIMTKGGEQCPVKQAL